MFDAESFCNDHSIRTWIEGKNCQGGWINIQCPFCDDHSNHGMFSLEFDSYRCWKCGRHSVTEAIRELLSVDWRKAKEIKKEYYTDRLTEFVFKKKNNNPVDYDLALPPFTGELQQIHKKYLRKRGFSPKEIIETWKVKGSTHLGNYRFRIIIPIILDGRVVSYQARDVTDCQELRYKACKIELEHIHHKYICYGMDYVLFRRGLICEGLLDAWKLGKGAVATFGTSVTPEQILFLADRLDEAFILFDSEKEAQKKADALCYELASYGVEVEKVKLNAFNDPGEMPKNEAENIRKKLILY